MYTLKKGNLVIPCDMTFKRVKNVNFRIKGDGSLKVSAPLNMSKKELIRIIHSKEEWISNHVLKINENKSLYPSRWKSGNKVSYLGESYTILVSDVKDIFIDGKCLIMPNFKAAHLLERAFYAWQKQKAEKLFSQLLDQYFKRLFHNNEQKPRLKVKNMKSRWGSYSRKTHRIHLNQHLMGYPMASIEYVVLHELAHIICLNHSKEFYAIIERHMPDYRQRIKALKKKKIK